MKRVAVSSCFLWILVDVSRRNLTIQEEGDRLENFHVVKILIDIRRRWLDNRNGRTHSVTYMSSDSHIEMISPLGDAVRKKVITEFEDAGMYGLSADTTPDFSRHDQLAVAIRYVKETSPTERLLALKHVSGKTGVATAENIVKVLQESTLDTSQLVRQSYDFPKTISGIYNGTWQKLQEIVGHDVPYMPWLSHQSSTVVEHGCASSDLINEMFLVLEAFYVFSISNTNR